MELGSCSRRSCADEVEADEAARRLDEPYHFELPLLAAATHTSLVLRASSLDPDAQPFFASPSRSKRLHFTDPEASIGNSDLLPSSDHGKAVVLP
jgi:hypothetical protein